jgi:hypothetical protein
MSPNPYRTFHYHACAHAFSGKFTRPFEHQIDVLAGSVLPIIGGHGQARAENFQFREFLSFKKGYSHVSGADQDDDKTHNTLVIASIEGLNILDIVTADRVVARLYSKHKEGEREGFFTIVGSRFENLRIADCEVDVDLDFGLFKKIPTYEAAVKDFKNKGDFYKIAHDPFKTGKSIETPDANGVFLCSCVKKIKTDDCPGVEQECHWFDVPGFGRVYLGELVIQHGQRTLTMIRFEIGSAVSGKGTAVQAFSNGRTYP